MSDDELREAAVLYLDPDKLRGVPPLKKPEIIRDENGRFDRHGRALAKTAKNRMNNKKLVNTVREHSGQFQPGDDARRAPGRPKGALNKTTVALKDMILNALNKVGGDEYLATLAVENSSAFAGLLGKVLPTTLAASESDGGLGIKMTFERHIVWPDGHKEIEGVTPKQLPPPSSHALPSDVPIAVEPSDIKDLD